MKKIALAYGITNSYVPKLANTLIGLKRHSKKFWDDIIVYNNDITDENKELLNTITPCRFINVEKQNFLDKISKSRIEMYSVATFFRFEMFNLLDEYEKIIWSDVDVLYLKDLSILTTYADKTGFAATFAKPTQFKVVNNFYDFINEYDMFAPMINAGLLVISRKLKNYHELRDWCYFATNKYSEALNWLDQGILNLLIQEFKIEVENIDLELFHCHPTMLKEAKKAYIIHAYGSSKFWNDTETAKNYPEWDENNETWLKISSKNKVKVSNQDLISVIMSVYERYDYIDEAIESILNQTYENFELLINVEKTKYQEKIVKYLSKFKDKRIKIIPNQEKLGFPMSLNLLIDQCNGKYIARMDDDDISLPTRFEKEVEFLQKNPNVGVVGANAEFFMKGSGKWFNKCLTPAEIKVALLRTNPMCHPSVMINKEMIDKYGIRYENYFAEDYQLWARCVKYFDIANIDEVLLKYRASGQNITSNSCNEDKIDASVKNTIQFQFKEYLNIDLNANMLELLQTRRQVWYPEECSNTVNKLIEELYEKVKNNNKKLNFYDQELIEKAYRFKKYKNKSEVKHKIKKGIIFCTRPVYNSIVNIVNNRIWLNNQYLENRINYIDNKIKNIEEKK